MGGYIYVIDPHIKVEGRSVVKIGFTTRSPTKRLQELQTPLPHPASLIHVAQFPDAKWAEKRLHDALARRKVQAGGGTEFFFLSLNEAVAIVNHLAYQVSVYEAKRALDRDLEIFREKVSNRLESKIAGWFAVAGIVGWVAILSYRSYSIGGTLAAIVSALIPALIIGAIGHGIGQLVVSIIWKEQIALERERLLEKYPAAKHTPPK